MLSNKTWGIAGAAMLGTAALLGTNAANAVIDLDATAANKANAAVTFAKETINATTTGSDGMTYYNVSGGESVLNVKAKVGMGGPSNSHLVVDYTFTGMVLGTDSTPRLAISGADSTCESTGTVEPNKGGAKGDNTVSFRISRSSATTGQDAILCLSLANAAVSMSGGSVRMTATEDASVSPSEHTAMYSNAVRIASGIKETTTTTKVMAAQANGYKAFVAATSGLPTVTQASVGGLTVTPASVKSAATGANVVASELYVAGETTANQGETATGISTVSISGDFSFATHVSLIASGGGACLTGADNDLRATSDTTKLKKQSLAYTSGKLLCITVAAAASADAVPIPTTAPYKVMVTYAGGSITAPKFPSMGMEKELGRIQREGLAIQLPYLTTNPRFKQRIRVANRGAADAMYSMEFHGEGDTAGSKAKGTFDKGETTILQVPEVVTPGNGYNTAATLTVEAADSDIDVVTVQTNPEAGTTDTVVLTKTYSD